MRVWMGIAWVCGCLLGCGGPLSEDELLGETSSLELSERNKSPPPLGPAYLLKDIAPPIEDPSPGPIGPSPTELVAFRGSLFFAATDFAVGSSALWRGDGTTAGTVPVKHLAGYPFRLTIAGRNLFFTGGYTGGHENELWVSDGTPQGTRLVTDLTPASGYAFTTNVAAVGNSLFFVRNIRPSIPEPGRQELWRSDGTAANTVRVADLGPEGPTGVFDMVALGNRLFFTLGSSESGVEPWVSDGTAQGTHLVKDIYPGAASSYPRNLTPVEGRIFFSANEPDHGRELWMSDGTSWGTVLVEDTRSGSESSETQVITVFKGNLIFATFAPAFAGTELRELDLDRARSHRSRSVASIPNPYAGGSGDTFIFVASSTVSGRGTSSSRSSTTMAVRCRATPSSGGPMAAARGRCCCTNRSFPRKKACSCPSRLPRMMGGSSSTPTTPRTAMNSGSAMGHRVARACCRISSRDRVPRTHRSCCARGTSSTSSPSSRCTTGKSGRCPCHGSAARNPKLGEVIPFREGCGSSFPPHEPASMAFHRSTSGRLPLE